MYENKRVNVIMPAYNEERTIGGMIRRVLAQKCVDTLILVSDGSSDMTPKIMKGYSKDSRVKVIAEKKNNGKGYAIRAGLNLVDEGIILIQDADEEYHPEDYNALLARFGTDRPVFGYRETNLRHRYILGSLAASVHNVIFNFLYGQHIKDINAGYKLFTKEMLKGRPLFENGFEIDPEIAVALAKNGYIIVDVPIKYSGRTFEEGKKIGAKDAIGIAFFLIIKRFTA